MGNNIGNILEVNSDGIWWIPQMQVAQNAWFVGENPMNMDDLEVPLF